MLSGVLSQIRTKDKPVRTTTSISPLEAGERLGKSKATMTRAIREGKLAAARDEDGRLWIEPAELARAFPTLAHKLTVESVFEPAYEPASTGSTSLAKMLQSGSESDLGNGSVRTENGVSHKALLDLARERDEAVARLQQGQEERDRERRAMQETISELKDTASDLRTRLDTSETERRQMTERVTALLTDQHDKVDEKPPEKPRGWFRRLIG